MNTVEAAYCQNYTALLRYAHRLTRSKEAAEDLLQTLFIKLKESSTNPELIEVPLAYCRKSVFGLYFNEVRTTERRAKRDYRSQEILLLDRQEWLDQLTTTALRMDMVAEFSNLLLKRQKAVFLLILEGKSIKEIAEIQGNSYNTIKANRKIIIEKLQTFFAERGEEFLYERKQDNSK